MAEFLYYCKDCGERKPYNQLSKRTDVCQPCMENRLRLVKALDAGEINGSQFAWVQKKLRAGHGAGKKAIDSTLGITP